MTKQIDTLKKMNNDLRSWLEMLDIRIMPLIDSSEATARALIDSAKAMVEHHADECKLADMRERRARALGCLQEVLRICNVCPQSVIGMQCPLCMDAICDRAFVPCGHMMCSKCISRTVSNRTCFTCRTPCTQVLRLYMN